MDLKEKTSLPWKFIAALFLNIYIFKLYENIKFTAFDKKQRKILFCEILNFEAVDLVVGYYNVVSTLPQRVLDKLLMHKNCLKNSQLKFQNLNRIF